MRVRDPEIVAAVVAGDPAGLAAAYDAYSAQLYTYCRSMLRDPDEAADAVHDTFVVASLKLGVLRDPERLRPWLYAVARNECLRALRARKRTVVGLADTDDVTDESADVTADVRREELRSLVRAAFDGLNEGDREILDLSVRSELSGAELGAVLGVSAKHAHALLSRARGGLEVALGALLVARAGSRDCAGLAELLADWDGRFNPLMRKRVNRHIEGCDVCRERRRGELQPAMLLGLGPILLVPPGLRARILDLCADQTPEAAARGARTARRAEPFDRTTGWPVVAVRRKRLPQRRRAALSATVALLLLLASATGACAALHLPPFRRLAARRADAGSVVAAPTAVPVTGVSPMPPPDQSAGPSTSPSPSTSTAGASASPYLIVTTAPAQSPSPSPTSDPSSVQLSPSPPSPSPSVELSGTPVVMDGPRVTGYFFITAEGGKVDYTISLPPDPATYGDPAVSPASGTLAAGQSQEEEVRITDSAVATEVSFDLTVNPGDIQVSVDWG